MGVCDHLDKSRVGLAWFAAVAGRIDDKFRLDPRRRI